MNKIIETQNITKIFKDVSKKVVALDNISLSVEEGEFLALVGPSGAGKSTLIHILGGLDYPSQGKAFFEGKNISSLSSKEIFLLRNQKVGFMFQFYHLISELTVLENIILPSLLSGCNWRASHGKAEKICAELTLSERINFYPSQLSGGQQQKVAFARAIINEPKVLFCDEPTGNLDHDSAENIRSLIKNLSRIHNTTIVLVTHNLELAKDATKVLNIKDGKLMN
jgi:ABC-type lipoprotein export system ATPase subunit